MSILKIICVQKRQRLYAESLDGASTNFATWSSDLENLKPTFTFMFNPLVVDVVKDGYPFQKPIAKLAANIEAELLDLQQDFALKSGHQSTVEFWKLVSVDKHPELRQTSQRSLSTFGTTYC